MLEKETPQDGYYLVGLFGKNQINFKKQPMTVPYFSQKIQTKHCMWSHTKSIFNLSLFSSSLFSLSKMINGARKFNGAVIMEPATLRVRFGSCSPPYILVNIPLGNIPLK